MGQIAGDPTNQGRNHLNWGQPGGPGGTSIVIRGTKIDALSRDLLERILKAAIYRYFFQGRWLYYHKDVINVRRVCKEWDFNVCGIFNRVHFRAHREADVDPALTTLRKYRSVTHVGFNPSHTCSDKLLKSMAKGFPSITSFDVELRQGVKYVENLQHFVSRRTSLQHLKLSYKTLREQSRTWLKYHSSLSDLDFKKLTRLQTLTVDCSRLYFPTEADSARGAPIPFLPVSETIAQLPELAAINLVVSNAGQVVQLPSWLGQLGCFASLSITCNCMAYSNHLVHSLAAMHSLQELRLDFTFPMVVGDDQIAPLNGLRALMSLALTYKMLSDSNLVLDSLERTIFNPRLRKLSLDIDRLPQLRAPMPILEELVLRLSTSSVQHNLFAFTPGLRSLSLKLPNVQVLPEVEKHLTGLTCLTML